MVMLIEKSSNLLEQRVTFHVIEAVEPVETVQMTIYKGNI